MTLDEAINGLIKDKMCNETPIETCVKKPCPDCDCYTIIELKDLLPVLSDAKNEIELYKKAIDWLADRCEILDKLANPAYESVCFKAKRWKEVALQKAREHGTSL